MRKRERVGSGSTGAHCEPLEGRVMMDGSIPPPPQRPPGVKDVGDFYFGVNDEHVTLARATDVVVVGFLPASRPRTQRLRAALNDSDGPLRGYHLFQVLDSHTFIFERSPHLANPSYHRLAQRIKEFPNVKYLAPSFYAFDDRLRQLVLDGLAVDLRDDVNPDSFFGPGFTDRKVGLGVNGYDLKLKRAGGLALLRLLRTLHADPRVEHAYPLTTGEFSF